MNDWLGMFGGNSTVSKLGLRVGIAALIAASSYSVGVGMSGLPANSDRGDVVSVTLTGHDSRNRSDQGVNADRVNDPKGIPVATLVKQAKKKDAVGFATRLETLKASPEFSGFLVSQAGSVEAGGIDGLAAVLTQAQVDEFVVNIRGKSLNVVVDDQGKQAVEINTKNQPGTAKPALAMTSSPTVTTAGWSGPSCWQGWLAAGGYAAATGAICGAVGAMSAGIGGAACGAGFWAFGVGINWNNACG
ncbi:hypothetical protein [Paenarthrobacter sp. NPDC057981]|uniref:hypothetical protein n=1 Tax=Paenarthrobacter sp. NPDC057981 TaxID=3346297 RepID=UPI0036DE09CE